MTVGSPTRDIIKFAVPLIGGYILQQMYLIIDAAIVGQFIGVNALAAVGASSSIMFLIMGFCNGSCAGFAIPVAQEFGAKEYSKMRAYVANALRIVAVIAVVITARHIPRCLPVPSAQLPGHSFHHVLQHTGRIHTVVGRLETAFLFPYSGIAAQHCARLHTDNRPRHGR